MGGVSNGNVNREEYEGRKSNVLRGIVSLENNGGFIQIALNLVDREKLQDAIVDASNFDGIEFDLFNGQSNEAGFETFNIQ
jgi:Complex I intermediate-associated protein 30 (CIA30)